MYFIWNTLKENIIPSCCLQKQTVLFIKLKENFYEDFYVDKNLFGFSYYAQDSKFFGPVSKKVIGKMNSKKT